MKLYAINGREEMVNKYGRDVIEDDERIWLERGYRVNYEKGIIEKV